MGASTFTMIFLVLLVSSGVVQAWLARRQIRHVSALRDAVPTDFAGQVSPEGHAKAADYSCAN